MVETVLQINGLKKNYGSILALDNLSFSVSKGNVYGILGPNGSGKTTALSILLGIIKATEGSFNWFGNQDLLSAKRKIGSLVETPNFYPYLSAEQNLKIVCEIKSIDSSDIDRVLRAVNLYERKESKYFTFSLGMKQRLALASLLLGDPEVLILDEPTNGLDPEGIAEVREIIIAEAKKGKTIIIASHILDEIEKVCSHVAVLKKGQLIANGRVGELLRSSATLHIASRDIENLYHMMIRSGFATTVEMKDDVVIMVLHEDVTTEKVNEYAIQNGMILTKLQVYQKSLESHFMELVKNEKII